MPKPPLDVKSLSDERFDRLSRRLIVAQALKALPHRTRQDVEAAARKIGVHPTTLYRDLTRLVGNGTMQDLAPRSAGFPKGRSRLHPRQEELIVKFLNAEYLTLAQPSMLSVAEKIGDACEDEGLPRPGRTAFIRRKNAIPERTIVLKRKGPKAAEQKTPRPGSFDVKEPWEVWQIDHTLADVIVVDAKGRPIGRVWLTVVIDVATRMVVAFYVGLDPPSRIRVATTLDLAISPKSRWLAARGLVYLWPAQGFPVLLHSDRAAEFRSPSLRRALLNQGVGWFLRPPGGARYGGHIERLIGTLMGTCRLLPGATHSSPMARGNYDSKASARLRIDELEMYFAHQILGVYHETKHSALGVSPLEAWAAEADGREPRFADDMQAFRLDLLPEIMPTIGRRGIKAFSEQYYSPALGDAYIQGSRKVVAKYDPRDLSRLYVQIPDRGYLEVPYRLKREGPGPTLWLLNASRRGSRSLNPVARNPNVRQGVENAEAVLKTAAARSGAAARQVERLRLERQAMAELRVFPAPPPADDDDWGGAFGGGEP
jgi:putative transposase